MAKLILSRTKSIDKISWIHVLLNQSFDSSSKWNHILAIDFVNFWDNYCFCDSISVYIIMSQNERKIKNVCVCLLFLFSVIALSFALFNISKIEQSWDFWTSEKSARRKIFKSKSNYSFLFFAQNSCICSIFSLAIWKSDWSYPIQWFSIGSVYLNRYSPSPDSVFCYSILFPPDRILSLLSTFASFFCLFPFSCFFPYFFKNRQFSLQLLHYKTHRLAFFAFGDFCDRDRKWRPNCLFNRLFDCVIFGFFFLATLFVPFRSAFQSVGSVGNGEKFVFEYLGLKFC